jgi:hypothetical protein
MLNELKRKLLPLTAALGVIFALGGARAVRAQEPQDDPDAGSRQIKLKEFVKERPAGQTTAPAAPVYQRSKRTDTGLWSSPKPAAATQPAAKPAPARRQVAHTTPHRVAPVRSQPAPPQPIVENSNDSSEVGITIWRLRPSRTAENGPKISFMTTSGLESLYTPVRISGTDPVFLDDMLRLSIESPRTGYLYVINRTQYADNSVGEASLIFPTARVRGGDNRVTAGRLVDIPDQEDTPNFFRLTRSKGATSASTGEILDIIVSPQPIAELTNTTRDAMPLTAAQVAKYSPRGAEIAESLELVGGKDLAWTQAEKEASTAGGRSLTQEEPTPQTVYRVRSAPGKPVMVTVQLVYGQTQPKSAASSQKATTTPNKN